MSRHDLYDLIRGRSDRPRGIIDHVTTAVEYERPIIEWTVMPISHERTVALGEAWLREHQGPLLTWDRLREWPVDVPAWEFVPPRYAVHVGAGDPWDRYGWGDGLLHGDWRYLPEGRSDAEVIEWVAGLWVQSPTLRDLLDAIHFNPAPGIVYTTADRDEYEALLYGTADHA